MPTTPCCGVSTYSPLTLNSSRAGAPALPDSAPLVTLWNKARSSSGHVGEPRITVGVGVEVVEERVFHFVIALGVRQRVVGFPQVPLAGEEGLVPCRFQYGPQGPLRAWQSATLALEGHRGHAAAVWEPAGLHRRAARRAAWLAIERKECHALIGEPINIRRGHAAPRAAAIDTRISVPEVVRYDQDDVGLLLLLRDRLRARRHHGSKQHRQTEPSALTDLHGFSSVRLRV